MKTLGDICSGLHSRLCHVTTRHLAPTLLQGSSDGTATRCTRISRIPENCRRHIIERAAASRESCDSVVMHYRPGVQTAGQQARLLHEDNPRSRRNFPRAIRPSAVTSSVHQSSLPTVHTGRRLAVARNKKTRTGHNTSSQLPHPLQIYQHSSAAVALHASVQVRTHQFHTRSRI